LISSSGTDSDFYFVRVDDPATAVTRIIDLAKTRIPKRFSLDPIRDIQVLCPMNQGGVGARSLNIELQAALNPAGDRITPCCSAISSTPALPIPANTDQSFPRLPRRQLLVRAIR